MPVESRWLVPGKIIHTDLVGDLTIDDIRAGSKGVIALLDESDHRMVHIIGNESRMGSMPKSLNLFTEAVEFMRHPRLGWFLMYPSTNHFAKFMGTMISSITRVNHQQFGTLKECLEMLARIDPTLPPVEEMLDTLPF